MLGEDPLKARRGVNRQAGMQQGDNVTAALKLGEEIGVQYEGG